MESESTTDGGGGGRVDTLGASGSSDGGGVVAAGSNASSSGPHAMGSTTSSAGPTQIFEPNHPRGIVYLKCSLQNLRLEGERGVFFRRRTCTFFLPIFAKYFNYKKNYLLSFLVTVQRQFANMKSRRVTQFCEMI